MQPICPAYHSRWLPLRRFIYLPSVVLICLLLIGFSSTHVSHAAGAVIWYVAPNGNDAHDCYTPASACRTIGATVTKANPGDQIMAATGVFSEHLILDKSLIITGAGADATFLDGVHSGTVISITNTVSSTTVVTITGVAIRNGQSSGIMNIGQLNLVSSSVTGNSGPGIVNTFIMTLTDVLVSNNTGGGINNSRIATLERMTISNNTSGFGGGIYNTGAITLTNVTLSGNNAILGGGIYTEGPAPLASGRGYRDHRGFGVYPAYLVRSVRLRNVTIDSNTASSSGGGIYNNPFALVDLTNTIIAHSTNGDCKGSGVVSGGYNLSSDASCGLTAPGDRMNTDPLLGPLQDNGGAMPTQALRPGSPAIDRGDPSRCSATDQRGVVRPVDGDGNGTAVCDIGAYELRWLRVFLPAIATKG